jgi:hypothetical protein
LRFADDDGFASQGRKILVSSPFQSTYAFTREIIGYDLAGFFQRNSATLQATVAETLQIDRVPTVCRGENK